MWQDHVIAAVQIVFVASLMPTILHKMQKPTFVTSATTAVGVYVFVFTVATLDLWFTAALMTINAVQWTVLAYQRWKLDRAPVVE